MKFVDVTNDIAFRKIFASEQDKKTLVSFLNAVIILPGNELIVHVELMTPYQLPNLSRGKATIVDIKAKDEKGNTYIVEMQIADYEFFHKRILYYTSQSYTGQIRSGEEYSKLKPVYFIGILEFEIGNNPSYFSRHKVLDVETKEQIIQDVEFNFIELPKFNKTPEQLETAIDQWTYFIKNAETLRVIPDNVIDEGLKEAYIEADKHNWSQQELEAYDYASMRIQDERGRLALAERKAEARGEARGEAIGEARGEANKAVAIAQKLKASGVNINMIVDATGLSKEEIEAL